MDIFDLLNTEFGCTVIHTLHAVLSVLTLTQGDTP